MAYVNNFGCEGISFVSVEAIFGAEAILFTLLFMESKAGVRRNLIIEKRRLFTVKEAGWERTYIRRIIKHL